MNQFCEMKGIIREFSVAKTSQQNRVDERKNWTLIEAARTMVADSKFPTTFWAEAVKTACYVQNKVLVVKPHNKTPYELFSCKAFRVFNSRRIVEENFHIRFNESTPNVVGTQPNGFVGTKANDNAGQARKETQLVKDLCYHYGLKSFQDDGIKPSSNDGKKVDDDPSKGNECYDQEKEMNVNITNTVNTISLTVNVVGTNEVNVVGVLPFDPDMSALEDIGKFDFSNKDEDNDAVANMNNLDTTIQVNHTPTTRIHNDHPFDQVIGDLHSSTQTRNMSKNLEEHRFVSNI
nr:ribonuclease H-like domain-containing protein [Tanacetum cinerariifolium]